jgi:small-conductance mechanosensitive channel
MQHPVVAAARAWIGADLHVAAAIVAGSLVVGLALRWLGARAIVAWAKRTETRIDDEIVASVRRPIPWWTLAAGVWLATDRVAMPQRWIAASEKAIAVALIAITTLWLADLGVRLLVVASAPAAEGAPVKVTGVARHVVRVTIVVVGGLVILGTLGVSIAPLLTTLGIGGLAVALALKDTLENVFAGIHVTLARSIRVGDFVKLETGEEGFVDDIGWRSTKVRLLGNSLVVLPNGRLAQSVVTNHDLPSPEVAVLLEVGVHYSSDLARVEIVTSEVGADVMQTVQGGVPGFTPFVRFHTFGASSVDFTVVLRAARFPDRFLVRHEFIKRLHARYAVEGIVIPFPIRAVNLEQEKVAGMLGAKSWSRVVEAARANGP